MNSIVHTKDNITFRATIKYGDLRTDGWVDNAHIVWDDGTTTYLGTVTQGYLNDYVAAHKHLHTEKDPDIYAEV